MPEISNFPKHIRLSKPKKEPQTRFSARSQLSYNETKQEKSSNFQKYSVGKQYFTSKIQKTVKKYLQTKRSSMGSSFNMSDYIKEPKFQSGTKTTLKNHKVTIDLDPMCDVSQRHSWGKGISSDLLPKMQTVDTGRVNGKGDVDEEVKSVKKEVGGRKRLKRLAVVKKGGVFFKVDQGLQTEEMESRESKRAESRVGVCDIQDSVFGIINSF